MRTWFVGALLLGVFAASTAEAQRVEIGIRLGSGAVDVAGYYSTGHYLPAARRVRPARAVRQYCEAEGRVLYCWEATPYWDDQPTFVQVYGVHPAHLERHHKKALKAHRKWLKHQRKHARRGWGDRRGRDDRHGQVIVVLGR
jgi:hypothetical protein